MKMDEFKTPAFPLPAAVLANQPVQPSFQSACQLEIGLVDGENERIVEYASVKPVG